MGEAREASVKARHASKELARASADVRNRALFTMAEALRAETAAIIAANQKDIDAARQAQTPEPLIDRLLLNEERIEGMAVALEDIARQDDPIGKVIGGQELSNGLRIEQIRVPMGVVAIIYEARPNVTSDAAGLAIKTGNATVLRGGSLANQSNIALTEILSNAITKVGLPREAIMSINSPDRAETEELMGLTGLVDVLIPRGGASLIQNCVNNAKVPVIETGTGNCHIYIHQDADFEMAYNIVMNAKLQRPGVCNAAESLLIDKTIAQAFLPEILKALIDAGVKVHADEPSQNFCPKCNLIPATQEDYGREYLDLEISVVCVDDIDEAISHINTYGTGHSEAIVTDSYAASEMFLNQVDASAVYTNASTRFTDGGVFGLGAEIGISTQKLHARGPMGAEALTTTKYVIRGGGQVR